MKNKHASSTNRPLLSLTAIVKDGGDHIVQMLQSVKAITDELIVVDTGSTDHTVEVCRGLGAKVYCVPWEHSFSAARNVALRKARGKYVIWMDADEVLAPEDAPRLRALLEKGEHQVYMARMLVGDTYQLPEYELEGFGQGSMVDKPRVFINVPGVKWVRRVHECLSLPANSVQSATYTDVKVQHLGQMTSTKSEYYHALLVLDHRDDPSDPSPATYLASGHILKREYLKALHYLERIDLGRIPDYDPSLRSRYHFLLGQAWQGRAAIDAGDDRERTAWYCEALSHYAEAKTSLARLQAAVIHICLGRDQDARRILEQSLEVDPKHLLIRGLLEIAQEVQGHQQLEECMVGYFELLCQSKSPLGAAEEVLGQLRAWRQSLAPAPALSLPAALPAPQAQPVERPLDRALRRGIHLAPSLTPNLRSRLNGQVSPIHVP